MLDNSKAAPSSNAASAAGHDFSGVKTTQQFASQVIALADLSRLRDNAEQRVLGCAQADASQLVVIKPADGKRASGLAQLLKGFGHIGRK